MNLKSAHSPAVRVVLLTAAMLVVCQSVCPAQSLSSFLPLGGLETIIGPLLPPCGIGSTFRSEVGTGLASASLKGATLKGSGGAEYNLIKYANLDEGPLRMDTYINLRLWRFGLHGNYWNFDTRSKQSNYGKVDLTGLILGGDVDVIQKEWFTFGAQADFYLLDPRFNGVLRYPFPELSNAVIATFNLQGDKPVTVGPYLRYIPPEILGWPVHLEAFWKIPIKGTRLNSVGARLVFRPQIYRFDIAARILGEQTWITFRSDAEDLSGTLPTRDWRLDMEWQLVGVDFSIYF